jgi:hypothetical protein
MDNKELEQGTFTFTYPKTLDLNVGSVTESVTVESGYFDSSNPSMFDVFDYIELKKKYPALQQAWEHYQTVLKLCRAKEAEENR